MKSTVTRTCLRLRVVVLIAACVLCVSSAAPAGDCGTIVPPGLVLNEKWTLAGSPYCVTGDIQVSLLTIQPGVEVLVDGPFEIQILSTLVAQGTPQSPILFAAKDNLAPWHGLKFQNLPPGTVMSYCRIEGSDQSGMTLVDSEPTLDHCWIVNNSAPVVGAGIHAEMSPGFTLTLNRCVIANNEANRSEAEVQNVWAGGIYIDGDAVLDRCVIADNRAFSRLRGGSCTPRARGGGLFVVNGVVEITNCEIRDNEVRARRECGGFGGAEAFGGGVYGVNSELTLVNCVFGGNVSLASGAFNEPNRPHGSGLYHSGGTVSIVNSTIARNLTEGIWNSGGSLSLTNSIVYNNNADGTQISGSAQFTCCDIQNVAPVDCNINFNPVFGGLGSCRSDLSIVLGSPCIDAGSVDAEFNDVCFPPSLLDLRNDMGANGGPLACNWWPSADGDLDDSVGILDFLKTLATWGECPPDAYCPNDVNCDGSVGILDLLLVLAQWS